MSGGPKSSINFHCKDCHYRFEAQPDLIADAPWLEHHPFEYFANCPKCNSSVGQAAWEKALFKAWTKSTGPKTAAGKAAVTENIKGHPTPEEAVRTRFNAMKHGLFARTATYFPAKPGKYPQCEGCDLLVTCHTQVACLKRTELFLEHQIAFETQDPALLTKHRAGTQAAVQALVNDMVLAIAEDGGPRLKSPEWYYDKDGGFHLAQFKDENGNIVQIPKIEAHPLVKLLMDFINKNAMTLADMEMTPKSRDEADAIKGYLDSKEAESQQSLREYQRQTAKGIEDLRGMIEASQAKTRRDPVLIEHGQHEES